MKKLLYEYGETMVEAVIALSIIILTVLVVTGHTAPKDAGYIVGQASWYSVNSCAQEGSSGITASGIKLNDNGLTCAMRSREFGKKYIVRNLDNGKEITVLHNDFGPAKSYKGRDLSDRIVDLSKNAFAQIAELDRGIIRVAVKEAKE